MTVDDGVHDPVGSRPGLPSRPRRRDSWNHWLTAGVVVAALVVLVGQLLTGDDGPTGDFECELIRGARDQVVGVQRGRLVPTSDTYTQVAHDVRRVALSAPETAAAPPLHAIADAYGQLAVTFRGFDPDDPATYDVIEQQSADVERLETQVEKGVAGTDAFLASRC